MDYPGQTRGNPIKLSTVLCGKFPKTEFKYNEIATKIRCTRIFYNV